MPVLRIVILFVHRRALVDVILLVLMIARKVVKIHVVNVPHAQVIVAIHVSLLAEKLVNSDVVFVHLHVPLLVQMFVKLRPNNHVVIVIMPVKVIAAMVVVVSVKLVALALVKGAAAHVMGLVRILVQLVLLSALLIAAEAAILVVNIQVVNLNVTQHVAEKCKIKIILHLR